VFCGYCGRQVEGGAQYCSACGRRQAFGQPSGSPAQGSLTSGKPRFWVAIALFAGLLIAVVLALTNAPKDHGGAENQPSTQLEYAPPRQLTLPRPQSIPEPDYVWPGTPNCDTLNCGYLPAYSPSRYLRYTDGCHAFVDELEEEVDVCQYGRGYSRWRVEFSHGHDFSAGIFSRSRFPTCLLESGSDSGNACGYGVSDLERRLRKIREIGGPGWTKDPKILAESKQRQLFEMRYLIETSRLIDGKDYVPATIDEIAGSLSRNSDGTYYSKYAGMPVQVSGEVIRRDHDPRSGLDTILVQSPSGRSAILVGLPDCMVSSWIGIDHFEVDAICVATSYDKELRPALQYCNTRSSDSTARRIRGEER